MAGKIGFIGAGRMAEAMIGGLISKKVYSKDDIIACAPSEETRKRISNKYGIQMYRSISEISPLAKTLVLAVKPKHVKGVLVDESPRLDSGHLLISIVAGIRIETLKSYVPDCKIVRVMPNHCCMVLEGAAGYTLGKNVTDADIITVKNILNALGLAVEVEENDMDAVTGVCGSSPAFAYMFIRAIAEVGIKNGLSEEQSIKLAAQSMIGAGEMVLNSDKTPAELVDNVCSPGGTTVEGVKVLEDLDFEDIVSKAIEAVIKRSKEMSRQ
jgi:pyrroline-5-carboxylate reductase